jgi:hypothetical protein
MKRVSMFKLDHWLIHGFSGLLNMCLQRTEVKAPIQEKVVNQLDKEVERFINLAGLFKTKSCKDPVDSEAELTSVDSWMWRGLNGMINMLEARVEQIAEPMHVDTVRSLKLEIIRLQQLVGKLSDKNVCS